MEKHIHDLAERIWNYHRMNQPLEKADVILVLCSHDETIAECAAKLYLAGWSPLLIFSGGAGAITRAMWDEAEADRFARIAIEIGVPRERILIENTSTNTGENITFTKRLLAKKNIEAHKFIVVQKPYMERRSYATFRKLWADCEVIVTSPQVSFDEYLANYVTRDFSADRVTSIMVGDLQRIKLYPAKGFQIYQEIPEDVWAAYEELVAAGYDKYLVQA